VNFILKKVLGLHKIAWCDKKIYTNFENIFVKIDDEKTVDTVPYIGYNVVEGLDYTPVLS